MTVSFWNTEEPLLNFIGTMFQLALNVTMTPLDWGLVNTIFEELRKATGHKIGSPLFLLYAACKLLEGLWRACALIPQQYLLARRWRRLLCSDFLFAIGTLLFIRFHFASFKSLPQQLRLEANKPIQSVYVLDYLLLFCGGRLHTHQWLSSLNTLWEFLPAWVVPWFRRHEGWY